MATSLFGFQLILNKTTPHFIRLPDRVQITLCIRCGNSLMQYAVKKHKGRDSHVGSTMDKYPLAVESLHHPAKSSEISGSRSFEIHWNMDIGHAKASDNAPLVCQCVVRGWKCEIDDRIKTSLTNEPKLALSGLASSAKPIAYSSEAVNLR